MLDLLVRICMQSVRIKKLVQESAIQPLRLNSLAPFETPPMCAETTSVRDAADIALDAQHSPRTASRLSASASQSLFLCWLFCLVALNGILLNEPLSRWLVYEIILSNKIEVTLKPLFTAAYQN
jgi:hypothetical protein